MRIGFIGAGVVGGATLRWIREHTTHETRVYDPPQNKEDCLEGCEAVIIAVPVPPNAAGQDTYLLQQSIARAKTEAPGAPIFIRSTVLPGTCDRLGVISMPEFLTERRAYDDVCTLPILVGWENPIMHKIFPGKEIKFVSNREAELAKFAHNCFGAVKVTYWNVIKEIADSIGADYDKLLDAAMLTGFIEKQHTMVPGPDGKKGYGGHCFPQNVSSIKTWLHWQGMCAYGTFFSVIENMNDILRNNKSPSLERDYRQELDA